MSRRMDCVVSDSLGGVLPYQVYATLVIRACSVTLVHPCRDDLSIDSRVHGNRTLYTEARPYHYKLLLLNCWFRVFFLAGMSREELGGIVKYCYNLLLYNVASTSASFLPFTALLNCWLISYLMLQDIVGRC